MAAKVPYPNYTAGLTPAEIAAVNAVALNGLSSAALTALSRRALNARYAANGKRRAAVKTAKAKAAAKRLAKAKAAAKAAGLKVS